MWPMGLLVISFSLSLSLSHFYLNCCSILMSTSRHVYMCFLSLTDIDRVIHILLEEKISIVDNIAAALHTVNHWF